MDRSIDERLNELQEEYRAGLSMLADLDGRRADIARTMLRIEGAIQVLREFGGEERDCDPSTDGVDNGFQRRA